MDVQRATIYFASGTGNSFRVARWLRSDAFAHGVAAEVIPITLADPAAELQATAAQLVCLSFPTHGFMPPWSMIKFLFKMPRKPGATVGIIATRGAFKLGPLIVPGAAGMATFLAAAVLLFKGYRPRGGLGLDMPANMLNLHWGLHPDNVQAITNRARPKVTRFSARILHGELAWWPLNVIWELSWAGLILWFWPLFPLIYLVFARVFMAKLMFSDGSCNGCGLCARSCPSQAIRMVGKQTPRPFWTHACEVCMRCMGYCKQHAIQASHAWAVLVLYLTSLFTVEALQRWLSGAGLTTYNLTMDHRLTLGVNALLALPGLILLYYLLWGLSRAPLLRHLISRLTLTRYYRGFHDPRTRLRQLTRREGSTEPDPED